MGANTVNDPDFTDEFCAFLQRSVTSVDAAELLLLIFRNQRTAWQPQELVAQLRPVAALAEADVQRYLDLFERAGLVTREMDRIRYQSSPADAFVATLARLYLERPVTLFRVIYALRAAKIATFADAFKLLR